MVKLIQLDWHFRDEPNNTSFNPKLSYLKSIYEIPQVAKYIKDSIIIR